MARRLFGGMVLGLGLWGAAADIAVSQDSLVRCAPAGVAAIQAAGTADYTARICAVLARAGDDAGLIDVVYVAPASGAGMRMPVNPEGGALSCGEAPRGERFVTVRDHPACGLALWVERYVAHELAHRRWEALHPGEPYGPRWQAEEAYADGYADGAGWRW